MDHLAVGAQDSTRGEDLPPVNLVDGALHKVGFVHKESAGEEKKWEGNTCKLRHGEIVQNHA